MSELSTDELLVWLVKEDGVVGLAMSAMEGATQWMVSSRLLAIMLQYIQAWWMCERPL